MSTPPVPHQHSTLAEQTIVIVDDHEIVLTGTLSALQQQYPQAQILTAQTAQEAIAQVQQFNPDLVVVDLSIPETAGETAQTEHGLRLLRDLMGLFPTLNITVQSTYVKALVRIRSEIDAHQGGFTVTDKGLSSREMLTRVDWALQGVTHTKDISGLQAGLEVKPEWLTVLSLAFQEGLQDKTIAQRMYVKERTVRHYWTKIQDVLGIYPEDDKKDGKNLRTITEIRAREEGLID
uniref:response regulator transcription factor n=1 Tax=Petrachloros mirabilis TaxID=2918835 RepID=UPI0030842F8F